MSKSAGVKARAKKIKNNTTQKRRKKGKEKKHATSGRQTTKVRKLKRRLVRDFRARNLKSDDTKILDALSGSSKLALSSQMLERAKEKLPLRVVQRIEDVAVRQLRRQIASRTKRLRRQNQSETKPDGRSSLSVPITRSKKKEKKEKEKKKEKKKKEKDSRCIPWQPSRLLNLPAELRNQIYEYVVVEPTAIDTRSEAVKQQIKSKTKNKKMPAYETVFRQLKSSPALAAACRQLRNEVLPVYFASNTFAFRYDLYSLQGRLKDRQISSFKRRAGENMRWVRKVKCALVHVISPKPAWNHMFCESILTAERLKAGHPIKVTVDHFHAYRRVLRKRKSQYKEAVGGCKCSVQAHIDGIVAKADEEECSILEIERLCKATPFETALLDLCPNCGQEQVVPQCNTAPVISY